LFGIWGRVKSKAGCDLLNNPDWHDAELEGICGDQGVVTDAVNQPWDTPRIAVNYIYCFRREYRVRLCVPAGKIEPTVNIIASFLLGKRL
jgi:hypothetical protein